MPFLTSDSDTSDLGSEGIPMGLGHVYKTVVVKSILSKNITKWKYVINYLNINYFLNIEYVNLGDNKYFGAGQDFLYFLWFYIQYVPVI